MSDSCSQKFSALMKMSWDVMIWPVSLHPLANKKPLHNMYNPYQNNKHRYE